MQGSAGQPWRTQVFAPWAAGPLRGGHRRKISRLPGRRPCGPVRPLASVEHWSLAKYHASPLYPSQPSQPQHRVRCTGPTHCQYLKVPGALPTCPWSLVHHRPGSLVPTSLLPSLVSEIHDRCAEHSAASVPGEMRTDGAHGSVYPGYWSVSMPCKPNHGWLSAFPPRPCIYVYQAMGSPVAGLGGGWVV